MMMGNEFIHNLSEGDNHDNIMSNVFGILITEVSQNTLWLGHVGFKHRITMSRPENWIWLPGCVA